MEDGKKNVSLDTESGYYSIREYARGWVRSGFDWRTTEIEARFIADRLKRSRATGAISIMAP